MRGSRRTVSRGLAAVASACLLVTAAARNAVPGSAAGRPDFGPRVLVFDPSMPAAEIQAAIDAAWERQGASQFGTSRDALLFHPGRYNLDVRVGYYTQVLGLGASPDDV